MARNLIPVLMIFLNNKNLDLWNRYGYVTNSKVKFVIVVDSSNTSLRDNEIRSVSCTSTCSKGRVTFGRMFKLCCVKHCIWAHCILTEDEYLMHTLSETDFIWTKSSILLMQSINSDKAYKTVVVQLQKCVLILFQMFRKLHNSFTDVMCNPFHNPGDSIQSKWVLWHFSMLQNVVLNIFSHFWNDAELLTDPLQGLWWNRFRNDGSVWLKSPPFVSNKPPLYITPLFLFVYMLPWLWRCIAAIKLKMDVAHHCERHFNTSAAPDHCFIYSLT